MEVWSKKKIAEKNELLEWRNQSRAQMAVNQIVSLVIKVKVELETHQTQLRKGEWWEA